MTIAHEGSHLYATDCANLFVGHPVSVISDGKPVSFYKSWSIFARSSNGEIATIGLPFDTRAEARASAERRCPAWDSGRHFRCAQCGDYGVCTAAAQVCEGCRIRNEAAR